MHSAFPIPEDFLNFKVPSETQTYATHSMLMGSVNRCRSAPCARSVAWLKLRQSFSGTEVIFISDEMPGRACSMPDTRGVDPISDDP